MHQIKRKDQKQSMGAEMIQSINLWFEKLLNLQIGNTSLYEKELIKNNLNTRNIEKELKNLVNNLNQLSQRADPNHFNQSMDNLNNSIIKVESNMMKKINSEFNLLFKYMLGLEYRLGEIELNHLNNFNNLRRDVLNKCVTSNENTTIPKENNNIKNIQYNIGGSLSPPQIAPTEYTSNNNNNINNTNNIKISSVAATTATAVIPNEIKIESAAANKNISELIKLFSDASYPIEQGAKTLSCSTVFTVPLSGVTLVDDILITKSHVQNDSLKCEPRESDNKRNAIELNNIQYAKDENKCNNIKNESVKNLTHAKSQENVVASNNSTSKIVITSPVKKVPAQLSGDWRQVGKKKKRKSQKVIKKLNNKEVNCSKYDQMVARTIEMDRVMALEQAKYQAKQNKMKTFNEWDFG